MKCPDCNAEINEVAVEVFLRKTFVVNHTTKQITPKEDSQWEQDDHAYHCPNCDSLNVDSELKDYKIDLPDWLDNLCCLW